MKARILILVSLFVFSMAGCKRSQRSGGKSDIFELTILQINDVYEIAPLEGGKVGGMARVASLKQELLKENPNTITVLSGDFLSPSLIGTMKVDGKRVYGEQMVEAMNAAKVDYVTFGNHEFDLKEADLLKRIEESEFEWISSNTFHKVNDQVKPFEKNGKPFPEHKILTFTNSEGKEMKVGVLGVCLPFNQQPYVHYDDVNKTAQTKYEEIAKQSDFVLAITHLNIWEDRDLAKAVPQLKMLIGGHEHENHIEKVGNVVLAKADANAKTAYVHKLRYHAGTRELTIDSDLRNIDEAIPLDPATDKVVQKWTALLEDGFSSQGFDLYDVVMVTEEPLDGREATIRTQPTNLGRLVAESMQKVKAGTQVAIVNSGSIRIDDQVEGEVTQMDILRMMPFGGGIVNMQMKGSLLAKTLETGWNNKGSGGYLQTFGVEKKGDDWYVGAKKIDPNTYYSVVGSDFLMSGRESNLGFLTLDNPEIKDVDKPEGDDIRKDIRLVLIDFLKKQ